MIERHLNQLTLIYRACLQLSARHYAPTVELASITTLVIALKTLLVLIVNIQSSDVHQSTLGSMVEFNVLEHRPE